MKGKIAFVLGAAVGYVLGTRAGRERYEQIKRGAEKVWNTDPVQRGVTLVKGAVDERADDLKAFAVRLGNDVFSNLARKRDAADSSAGGSAGTGDPGTGRQGAPAAEPELADAEPASADKAGS